MTGPQDLRAIGERIERLLEQVQASCDAPTWNQVQDVVRLVTELHGAGVERILDIVKDAEEVDDPGALLERIAGDDLVASLLVVHDLHPVDLETRVSRALDGVRPYLGSHGGDVALVAVDDEAGAVLLRMLGSCDGCPSSSVTLKLAVETAIQEAAPEVVRIDVEGDVDGDGVGEPTAGVTPVTLTRKPAVADPQSAWVPVYGLNRVGSGRVEAIDIEEVAVVCCRVGRDLFAYRDRCASCSATLRDGVLDDAVLRCTACGSAYDVRLAGRAVDGGTDHLEPLPLLEEPGVVRISLPTAVTA